MPEIDDTQPLAEVAIDEPERAEAQESAEEPTDETAATALEHPEPEEPGHAEPEEPGAAETAAEAHQAESGAEEPPAPSAPDAALVEGVAGGLTWIPFAAYLGLWVVLAGLSAYFLYDASAELPARWMPEYVPLLWSGVALTAIGPLLSLVVWLVARSKRPAGARRGLFASAFTRGALVAFFGVVLWLGTLFVLELIASGWTL